MILGWLCFGWKEFAAEIDAVKKLNDIVLRDFHVKSSFSKPELYTIATEERKGNRMWISNTLLYAI